METNYLWNPSAPADWLSTKREDASNMSRELRMDIDEQQTMTGRRRARIHARREPLSGTSQRPGNGGESSERAEWGRTVTPSLVELSEAPDAGRSCRPHTPIVLPIQR